jgi:DNA-binding CsgD family transcriptional regulator
MPRADASTLLERADELTRLTAALEAARAGSGAIALIDGPAGIGKTALLRTVADRASAAGMDVLAARGQELEHEFAFGVARQLLEPVMRAAEPERRTALLSGAAGLAAPLLAPETGTEAALPAGAGGRAARAEDRAFSLIHGLYWTCANLAEEQPLVVCVDDVHWADPASARFLAYLGARARDLPLLLVAAVRGGEMPAGNELTTTVDGTPEALRIEPASLSEGAVAEIIAARLGALPDPAFARACAHASAGNPFLLGELINELRADGVTPEAAAAPRVERVQPASVARSVVPRLARMGDEVQQLARAVALLETAPLADAAQLAALDRATARDAADRLVAAHLLSGGDDESATELTFVHPLLRGAVYETIGPAQRSDGHRRASLLLARRGARGSALGTHLLRGDTTGDPQIVALCRRAAADALARGAPGTATRLLSRALAEPPGEDERGAVLGELGEAETLAREEGAGEHLRAALAEPLPQMQRVRLISTLAPWLVWNGHTEEAQTLLADELDGSGHELPIPLRAALEMVRSALGSLSREHIAVVEGRLDELHELALAAGPAGAPLLITEGCVRGQRDPWDGPWRELLDQGLAGGLVAAQTGLSPVIDYAAVVLVHGDEFARARRLLDEMRDDAIARGSIRSHLNAIAFAAVLALRGGDLARAEDDARTALELAVRHRVLWTELWAGAALTQTLIDRGRLDEAEAVVAAAPMDSAPGSSPWLHAALARARLRIAQGRPDEARGDLERIGALTIIDNPSYVPWRSTLATALGTGPEAAALAADELDRARALGQPRGIAGALRAAAAAGGHEEPVVALAEAVALLRDGPARLELARALCDLGSAQRRRGERRAAREPLREAAELARACGAVPLEARAREELLASGARPRREHQSGPAALTPSELRVAELAAAGQTNREIAQALFVTAKTVGTHLGHIYDKLGLAGPQAREQLPSALGGQEHTGQAGPVFPGP